MEILRLRFRNIHLKPEDIKVWDITAVSRIIRELEISYDPSSLQELNILPSNLYTCKSLVTLKLDAKIILDVPRMACLPSLKTLHLRRVIYFNEDCLQRLLSALFLKILLVDR